jgi:hypothetical protein
MRTCEATAHVHTVFRVGLPLDGKGRLELPQGAGVVAHPTQLAAGVVMRNALTERPHGGRGGAHMCVLNHALHRREFKLW